MSQSANNAIQNDLANLKFCKLPPSISVNQAMSAVMPRRNSDSGEIATARSPVYASTPAAVKKPDSAPIKPGTAAVRGASPILRSSSPNLRAHGAPASTGYNVPKAFATNVQGVVPKNSAAVRPGAKKSLAGPNAKRMPSELEITKRELDEVRNLVEALRRQADEDAAKIEAATVDKEKVDSELAEALEQKSAIVQQFNMKVTELEDHKRRIDALQLSEATLIDEVHTLQRQVVSLQEEHRLAMDTAERRIAAITAAANKRMAEADACIVNLQNTIKELQGKLHEEQAAYVQLQQDKEREQQMMDGILREGEHERVQLHNAMQEMKGNIRVYCRVRPLIAHDREYREMAEQQYASRSLASRRASSTIPGMEYIQFPDRADHRRISITMPGGEGVTGERENKDYQFQFDKVFEPSHSQDEIFEDIQQLVQSALDGYKVCIFAYGQTGSGKTYTMEGPGIQAVEKGRSLQGMIPRSVEQVFDYSQKMKSRGWSYSLSASFVEIYNEEIRDLLNASESYQHGPHQDDKCHHEIRNVDGYTILTGVTEVPVTDARTVHTLLNISSQNRKSFTTAMNDRASRSHSVFSLKIVGTHEGSQQQVLGVLNLIDLAGSERVALSGAQGDRLKEAASINKSLTSLGDVIVSLAKGDAHVPYRNSKLTHMLQPYMGNESKTLMFVNVSPSELFLAESLNSLRFAAKVNACEIGLAKKRISSKK